MSPEETIEEAVGTASSQNYEDGLELEFSDESEPEIDYKLWNNVALLSTNGTPRFESKFLELSLPLLPSREMICESPRQESEYSYTVLHGVNEPLHNNSRNVFNQSLKDFGEPESKRLLASPELELLCTSLQSPVAEPEEPELLNTSSPVRIVEYFISSSRIRIVEYFISSSRIRIVEYFISSSRTRIVEYFISSSRTRRILHLQ